MKKEPTPEQWVTLWAYQAMQHVAWTGYPSTIKFSVPFWLGGPVIGLHMPGAAATEAPAQIRGPADCAALIADLDLSGGAWAIGLADGGDTAYAMTTDGLGYIPPGVFLPANVDLLHADPASDFGVGMFGWPAPEHIVLNARHYGWMDRLTTVLATAEHRRGPNGRARVDPFRWVRDLAAEHVKFQIVDADAVRSLRTQPAPLGWPHNGGRHRLDVTDPNRYRLICDEVERFGEDMLQPLAELTLTVAAHAATLMHDYASDGDGAAAQLWWPSAQTLLTTAANTDPADMVARRRRALHFPGRQTTSDPNSSLGLPTDDAPQWAHAIDAAYGGSDITARVTSTERYNAIRMDDEFAESRPAATREELDAMRRKSVRAFGIARALEALLFWSADPLPIADIVYAADSVTRLKSLS